MAATLELPVGPTGLTLTATLYPDGSDTAAVSGVALTEATSRKGYYTGSVTGLDGLHFVEVLNGAAVVAMFWANMGTAGRIIGKDSWTEAKYDGFTIQDLADAFPALSMSDLSNRFVVTVGAYAAGQAPLQPTTAGRTLDVDLSHQAPATLSVSERDALATALLDLADGVEVGKTLRQSLRIIAAGIGGKRSNAGTATEQYDAIGHPGTARIVGNSDSDGNGTPTLTP